MKRNTHIVDMIINTCRMKLIAVISWPVLCGRYNCHTVSLWTLFHILQTRIKLSSHWTEYKALLWESSLHCEEVQICAQWRTTHTYSIFVMNSISNESEGGGSRNNHWCISHLPLNNRLLWHTDKKHGLDSYSSHYLILHTGRSHEPEACFTLLVPQHHLKCKRYQSVCVAKLSDHISNLQCWTLTQLNPGCPEPGLNPAWPGPPHIHNWSTQKAL